MNIKKIFILLTAFSAFSASCFAAEEPSSFCVQTKKFKKDFYAKGTCVGTCIREERSDVLKKMQIAECLCLLCVSTPTTAGFIYGMWTSAIAGTRVGFYIGASCSGIACTNSIAVIAKTCKDLKHAERSISSQIPAQIEMGATPTAIQPNPTRLE